MNWPHKTRRVAIAALRIHTDSHTHILPEVDDGVFTPHTAAATLEKMHRWGVRRVCLTPHVMTGVWDNDAENLHAATARFERALTAGVGASLSTCALPADIPILTLGAEYMVDEAFGSLEAANLLVLPDRCVLIEMSWLCSSPGIFESVERLVAAGLTPVLAHPERYLYWAERLGEFDRLHAAGCGFQLNLASTVKPNAILHHLMRRGWYTHVGTDLHSPRDLERLFATDMPRYVAEAGAAAGLWDITNQ